MAMDDYWLSELEKGCDNDEIMVFNNDLYQHPSEEVELFLEEGFHQFSSGENSSPIIHNNLQNPNNCSQFLQTQQFSPQVGNDIIDHNNNPIINLPQEDSMQANNVNVKRKRKREASGAYHHIVAERKRRELHSQRFIALSALVPNLKKVDKGSILVETINYLKQLQEKVKGLEEVVANQNVESMVVVKKSQLVVDNEDDDDHGCSSKTDRPSDIEVHFSNKTLLLKLYCEKQEGLLSKIFTELEKKYINILNCSSAPIGTSSIHITIVAQTEKVDNFQVKKLVKTLESILRSQ